MSHLARSRRRWWLTVLVLMVFCVSLVQPALAAGPSTTPDSITLLRQYNIVRGDGTGDLMLGSPITRAQLATILVRIAGYESEVENLMDLGFYSDTKDHWAKGYAAAARIHGLLKGFDDGTFHPEENVTWGQAFTMALRLVGTEPDAGSWPTSALLGAMDLHIVPAGFKGVSALGEPALRGEIFDMFVQTLTTVKTSEGQTYFQKYVDNTAPEITVAAAEPTPEATYTLTGTAKGASQVTVNGESVTLTGDSFSKTVSLKVGNNELVVKAYDLAGNMATATASVIRTSPAARVEVSGPSQVQVNGKAVYTVKAYDENGNVVPMAGATAKVTGNIGTFDLATGTLTTGSTTALGTIEVTLGSVKGTASVSVLGASASASSLAVTANNVAYTQGMTVRVQVRDADGDAVTDDFGRPVSLSATGLSGLSVTPAVAYTAGGVAEFTVRGTSVGEISLTATSAGLASGVSRAKFTTTTHVVLVTDTPRISTTGGEMARVRAELRDDKGNTVQNRSGKDIVIDLTATGPGNLLQSTVRIAMDATNSAQTMNDGLLAPGQSAGTTVVTGTMRSEHSYSIDTLSVQTYVPTVGAGTSFRVVPMKSRVSISSGEWASFMVQLVDANGSPIAATDYAFQVAVSTSNNETVTAGVPNGVDVRIGDSGSMNPVYDGKTTGEDVVARTSMGSAVIEVRYNKPGTVTLKPVAVGSTDTAYNTDLVPDVASGSQSSWVTSNSTGSVTFTATPTTLKLTVDSDLFGDGAPAANVRAGSSRSLTLHAYIAYRDAGDPTLGRYWVPETLGTVDLYKNGTKVATAQARDGKADFTISSPSTAGSEDEYVVKDGAGTPVLTDSNSLYVRADGQAPSAAGLPINRGIPSYTTDQVLATDTDMEIDLPIDGTQRYVIVRVYVDGSSSAIYTSGPVDVSGGAPQIRVPKSALPAGVRSFYVRYKNGYGESSDKGVVSYPVTNYTLTSSVSITSAKLDLSADGPVLYLYGSGFSAADLLDGSKISISDPSIVDPNPNDSDNPGVAYLSGAQATYDSTTRGYKLDLTYIPGTELDKIFTFAGSSVKLSAEAGWYTKSNGQMASEDLSNSVGAIAKVDYAAYDSANKRLVIYGRGFQSGTLQKANITVGTHTLSETGMAVSVSRDSEIWVTLSADSALEVETTPGVKVSATDGWFVDSTTRPVSKMGAFNNVNVFGYVRPTSVTYDNTGKITIWGQGFVNGQIGSGTVKIVDVYRTGTHEITLVPVTPNAVSADGRSVSYTFANDTDKTDFLTNYRYKVYLVAEDGWFQVPVDGQFRDAAGIPDRTLKFSK